MRRPYIVSIEGNIGSGKTTLIRRLEERGIDEKKCVFLREPLDIWNSVRDSEENILQKYYREPEKYALPFQIMAYITFHQRLVDAIKDADENTVIICERSMESSCAIFAKMLRESGIIDEVNFQILLMFYEKMELIPVDAIIYLNTDVKTNIERIKKRARPGEENITLEYLENCRKNHEDWIKTLTSDQSSQLAKLPENLVVEKRSFSDQNDDKKTVPVLRLDESLNDSVMMRNIDGFIRYYSYKMVGLCEGCNVENKLYSDEKLYILEKKGQSKLLCKKCFDDCWSDAYDDGWFWDSDILFTGEEYETDSI